MTAAQAERDAALAREAATAEVLAVINANPGNLLPVFDTMLEKAMRLCGVAFGVLRSYDGDRVQALATRGVPKALADFSAKTAFVPVGELRQALQTGQSFHQPDIREHEGYKTGALKAMVAMADLGGARTVLQVPLVNGRVSVGLFTFFRQEVRAFADREIALLESFAAQAVIAMENARLLTEQREALERQTATAEVLGIINVNPGNLAPVFDTILEKAMRLCGVAIGIMATWDGTRTRAVASRGVPNALATFFKENATFESSAYTLDALRERRSRQTLDPRESASYREGHPVARAMADLGGARTHLFVPLVKDDVSIGNFYFYRQEIRAFTGKEIALLESFAAQAVIAMENARLLTEQQEALEQQTATANVLAVINANPGNLVPVFDVMLDRAMRICGAAFGSLHTTDGTSIHTVAMRGMPEAYVEFRGRNPVTGSKGTPSSRVLATGKPVNIADMTEEEVFKAGFASYRAIVELGGVRAHLNVPLLKDGVAIGFFAIYRAEIGVFSDRQVALVENFAAQAVIAMENARLLDEQREALDRQTATAEVLGVINANPGNLAPVFQTLLDRALRLCGAAFGELALTDGETATTVAIAGMPGRFSEHRLRYQRRHGPGTTAWRLMQGERTVHIPDLIDTDSYRDGVPVRRALVDDGGMRAMLAVPLSRDGTVLGLIMIFRHEPGAFTERQVALLESFAAQAVIAMENARLITEQQEALDRQTATAEVLQVINANPGNLGPVFDVILAKAHAICGADRGGLFLLDGAHIVGMAVNGYGEDVAAVLRQRNPIAENGPNQALVAGARYVHTDDIRASTTPPTGAIATALRYRSDVRTNLIIPLRRDGELIGSLSANRSQIRPYKEAEIAVLESFAAQAVIAIENARLLNAVRQREDELRVTFENMGDGVAMFDRSQRLVAWNRKFQDILDLPEDTLAQGLAFADYIRTLAARGEYGPHADAQSQVQRLLTSLGQQRSFERTRPNGRTVEVRNNPVADGGFVLIYADITERKRAEAEIAAARDAAEQAARTIEAAYRELKIAQANLIQAEKMASLGQLTAGIAHEIKNPLNFVNNFADLSVELLGELTEAIAPAVATFDEDARADVDDLTATLTTNLQKITEHGRRADGIVRSMLEHSRGTSGERRSVDLNAIVEEALNLAYHGARAQDQGFHIILERHYAEGLAPITLTPQDITRVFVNLINNGFYAADKRAKSGTESGFAPTLAVTTRDLGDAVEIRVRDNGTGIPPDIRDKLFQPFFTTKPTGEGTGLGLSITYDIVTKQHGGTIAVDSDPGGFTEFTVTLPRGDAGVPA